MWMWLFIQVIKSVIYSRSKVITDLLRGFSSICIGMVISPFGLRISMQAGSHIN